MRWDRMQVNDYSEALLRSPLAVFIRSSGQYQLNTWRLLAVYDLDALLCYGGLLVASLLVLMVTLAFTNGKMPLLRNFAIQSTAFISHSAVLKSYTITLRHGYSTKTVCFAFCLLSIVMFAYLRAGLLSKLAVRTPNIHLHTLQDIIDNKIKVIIPSGGGIYSSFANAKPSTLRGTLWANNIKPHSKVTLNKDMRGNAAMDYIINHGDYAFVTLEATGQKHPAYPCSVGELEERISIIDNGFAYQKDWPLKGLFNYYFSKMRADGVVQKMFDK